AEPEEAMKSSRSRPAYGVHVLNGGEFRAGEWILMGRGVRSQIQKPFPGGEALAILRLSFRAASGASVCRLERARPSRRNWRSRSLPLNIRWTHVPRLESILANVWYSRLNSSSLRLAN